MPRRRSRIRAQLGAVWSLAVKRQWIPLVPGASYEAERYEALLDDSEPVMISVYLDKWDYDGYTEHGPLHHCLASVVPHLPDDKFPPAKQQELRDELQQALFAACREVVEEKLGRGATGEETRDLMMEMYEQAQAGPECAGRPIAELAVVQRIGADGRLIEVPYEPGAPYWRKRPERGRDE